MAGHEGYLPTKWVVAMVRTKLTGQPHVGQPELERLTRSNQQLLALGACPTLAPEHLCAASDSCISYATL
jgi:hypothetical protein